MHYSAQLSSVREYNDIEKWTIKTRTDIALTNRLLRIS